MNINIQYQNLLREILKKGYEYTDTKRDVKCKQIDHKTLEIDLQEGFPAINLRKLYWKGVVAELLWFLRGDTNIKWLVDNGINIWNKDAYNWYLKEFKNVRDHESLESFINGVKQKVNLHNNKHSYNWGDLGRIYGAQWRRWDLGMSGKSYLDQISNLIKNLKEQPMSRRHIVTAWNPAELDDMALPPCHWSFEIIVRPLNYIERFHTNNQADKYGIFDHTLWGYEKESDIKYGFTLKWHQRSVDTYLGLPFNIASYALLAHIIGKLTNMVPMKLIGDLSNVHLYENSWEASRELVKRDPLKYDLPNLKFNHGFDFLLKHETEMGFDFDNFTRELLITDFQLKNYQSYDNIPVEMLSPKV